MKEEGNLKIWWIPQVPMKAFEVQVANIVEAKLLLDTLAQYDLFQFANKIKPDYCNTGGLVITEGGEWVDWELSDQFLNLAEKMFPANFDVFDTLRNLSLEQVRQLYVAMGAIPV